MAGKGRILITLALAASLAGGLVFAQERGTSDLAKQCEAALRSRDYLNPTAIKVREVGSGKIVCEGTCASKVHACAVFLACMSVRGVQQVDLTRLKLEHMGESLPPALPQKGGGDVLPGVSSSERLGIYAVVLNPDDVGPAPRPGATPAFRGDVIVIGDVPPSVVPHPQDKEYPSGNPGNQVPNRNDANVPGQPIAPHNPGAYPNSDPGEDKRP
ncbi:MAG TPA: hypothetical protein VFF73_16350 [Planctomycetota bacterium]|nr:hypothetical protein [Planctomycetota bacterium]